MRELRGFFMRAFSRAQFDIFLHDYDYESVIDYVEKSQARALYFNEVAKELQKHNLIDVTLFKNLREARPKYTDTLNDLEKSLLHPTDKTDDDTAQPDDQRRQTDGGFFQVNIGEMTGDIVHGDNLSVGDISGSSGVAFGRDSKSSVNTDDANKAKALRKNVLDAAIRREVRVGEATLLLVLVRDRDSKGLYAILELEPEYMLQEEDVRHSRPFKLYYPVDASGNLLPTDIEIVVSAPDFDPPTQSKIIEIPPVIKTEDELEPVEFMLTPVRTGTLQVIVEVYQKPKNIRTRVGSKPLATVSLKSTSQHTRFGIISIDLYGPDDDPVDPKSEPPSPWPLNVLAFLVGAVLSSSFFLFWRDALENLYESLTPEFQGEAVIGLSSALLIAVLGALFAQYVKQENSFPKWFELILWSALPVSIVILASLFIFSLSEPKEDIVTAVSPPATTGNGGIVTDTVTVGVSPPKPLQSCPADVSYIVEDDNGRRFVGDELQVNSDDSMDLFIQVTTSSGCSVEISEWPSNSDTQGVLVPRINEAEAISGIAKLKAEYTAPRNRNSFDMKFHLKVSGAGLETRFLVETLKVKVN